MWQKTCLLIDPKIFSHTRSARRHHAQEGISTWLLTNLSHWMGLLWIPFMTLLTQFRNWSISGLCLADSSMAPFQTLGTPPGLARHSKAAILGLRGALGQ